MLFLPLCKGEKVIEVDACKKLEYYRFEMFYCYILYLELK